MRSNDAPRERLASGDDGDVVAARRALEQAGAHFALTPARTLPGLTVKLRHLVQDVEKGRTFWTQALARAVLTDAENMCA